MRRISLAAGIGALVALQGCAPVVGGPTDSGTGSGGGANDDPKPPAACSLGPSSRRFWSHAFDCAGATDMRDGGDGETVLVSLAGVGSATLSNGSLDLVAGQDAIVARMRYDGSFVWASKPISSVTVFDMAPAADGGAIVTGDAKGGPADFGGVVAPTPNTDDDVFVVATLDGTGATTRAVAYPGKHWSVGQAVAADAQGNSVIAAEIDDGADFSFDGSPLRANQGSAVGAGVIGAFDPAGTPRWSARFAAGWSDVRVTASGTAVVAGDFTKRCDFGGGVTLEGDGRSPLVAAFDPNGAPLWAKTASHGKFVGVELDAAGNAYVLGTNSFDDTVIDFGDGVVTTDNGHTFVVKYSPTGTVLWASRFEGYEGQQQATWTVTSEGQVLIAEIGSAMVYLRTVSTDGKIGDNVSTIDGNVDWVEMVGLPTGGALLGGLFHDALRVNGGRRYVLGADDGGFFASVKLQ